MDYIDKILQGDCTEVLKTLPSDSINCCVTSPPYYGLRDYGCDGQIGLEETPEEYISKMVDVFREVKRVLKDDGTLWVNIGDSYANRNSNNRNFLNSGGRGGNNAHLHTRNFENTDIKTKDLIGIPWMLAFALRRDGWYLRQDIIWHKPNPMPESVRDRCTKSHEYIFLLSKKPHYYFDYEAIQEKSKWGGSIKEQAQEELPMMARGQKASIPNLAQQSFVSITDKRNKRDVWSVTTKACKEAHFATFPEDLIEPCILAGCPVDGVVLDPFFGSGTTGRVCAKLNRRYVGIELNPAYIEIAEHRTSKVQMTIPGF